MGRALPTGPDVNNGRSSGTFTVDAQTRDSAAAPTPMAIGPLSITGPSISLVDTKFNKGILTLTIGIGADSATLAFGAVTASLTGILATFDVQVNILQAIQAIQNPSALLAAFSVPGKFSVKVASLNITIPDIIVVTATNLSVKYDPTIQGSQELVSLTTASISFPAVGLSANIGPSYNAISNPTGRTMASRSAPTASTSAASTSATRPATARPSASRASSSSRTSGSGSRTSRTRRA